MTNLVRWCVVVLAVATVSGVAGVRPAQAEDPAGIGAGAQTPDAERAEQIQRIINDAVTFGRRTETTFAGITEFTEYIPNGDYFADPSTAVIRTGLEYMGPNGKVIVLTKYWRHFQRLGVVTSVKDEKTETVIDVFEEVPDSIDLKVGDTRPVQAVESTAAGTKPHTLDPKRDGSLGHASGGAGITNTNTAPVQETVVREKAIETPGGETGTRQELDHIKVSPDRELHPFVESKPKEPLPYSSGMVITNPDWGPDVDGRVEIHADKDGKVTGVVASVREGRQLMIVYLKELVPGGLGDLKVGDTRELGGDLGRGNEPSTWNPKPRTDSTGSTNGGTQSSGGAQQDDASTTTGDGERAKAETAPDGAAPGDGGSAGTGATSGDGGSAGTGATSGDAWAHVDHHQASDKDGTRWEQDTYRKDQDDGTTIYMDVTTFSDANGNTTTETRCYSGGDVVDCPTERTDEPTCTSSCEHLAVFLALFCAEADCAAPPEGMRPDPAAGPDAPCAQVAPLQLSTGGSFSASGSQKDVDAAQPDCTNADRPGGPVDDGDPLDPNGAEPPDSSEVVDPRDDGVTDPVDPGEPEDTLVIGTRLDLYGTLRDPANPPGTEDTAPAGERPTTGEAERNPLP